MLKAQQQAKTQTEGLGIKMKKFLILLLSLFCIKLGAYAVGVDCWEEYTTLETPPATSDLRTAITNAGGTVVKLHTRAKAL